MESTIRSQAARGFTLAEVLVVVAVAATILAVVGPTTLARLDEAEPVRVADDLSAVRSALDLFLLDTRVAGLPGDLEDLVNRPDSTDADPAGRPYRPSVRDRWAGPYMDRPLPSTGQAMPSARAFRTGYGGQVATDLLRYDAEQSPGAHVTPSGVATDPPLPEDGAYDFLAVPVHGLDADAFDRVEELIEGPRETLHAVLRRRTGRLRHDPDSGITFYLLIPYPLMSSPGS